MRRIIALPFKALLFLLKSLGILIAFLILAICARMGIGYVLVDDEPTIDWSEVEMAEANAIHRAAIVVDGHNDLPSWVLHYGFDFGMDGAKEDGYDPFLHYALPIWPGDPGAEDIKTHTDLRRIEEGGLDAQFYSIWVDCAIAEDSTRSSRQQALDMIAALSQQVEKHSDRMAFTFTSDAVVQAVAEGKHAVLMGLEGGHAIEDDIEVLREFYDRGIRYMTLTHTCTNNWADSSGDVDDEDVTHHGGLSEFGFEVVKEMNRLGMIVDVSHVSDETFWDVIEMTSAPVMASHSSARAIADHGRNMSDDMLKAVADNGGVVMINFFPNYIDPAKTNMLAVFSGWHWFWNPGNTATPLSILIDHIDHVARVAGVDHVGLGSDFDGVPSLPEGLDDVSDLPKITYLLLERGYSEEDIHKILGGNALRVMAEVERVASFIEDDVQMTAGDRARGT